MRIGQLDFIALAGVETFWKWHYCMTPSPTEANRRRERSSDSLSISLEKRQLPIEFLDKKRPHTLVLGPNCALAIELRWRIGLEKGKASVRDKINFPRGS